MHHVQSEKKSKELRSQGQMKDIQKGDLKDVKKAGWSGEQKAA